MVEKIKFENQDQKFKELLYYWKQHLSDIPQLSYLPINHFRSTKDFNQKGEVCFLISKLNLEKLNLLSQRSGCSVPLVLLTCLKILLFRYTGQEDIIVNYLTNNFIKSKHSELNVSKNNIIPLLTNSSGNPCFDKLIRKVKEVFDEAYIYKDVSFEMLTEALTSEFGQDVFLLFQILFIYKVEENLRSKKKDSDINESVKVSVSLMNLTLSFEHSKEGLAGTWKYTTALFDLHTIERISKHFLNLLESLLEGSHLPISQLPLLSQKERYQLVNEWNQSHVEYPALKAIHKIFEEQAEKTPDAIAVVYNKYQLTYKELNELSNQLAFYLINKGVEKEKLVPICIGRSMEMIVGILGILKAGGAYVPIDPDYPEERIRYILEDTGATLILTSKENRRQLQNFNYIEVISLDDNVKTFNNQQCSNPVIPLSLHNLAYVIYTSGSTGVPKGVMVEHKALIDHCYGVIKNASLNNCASFALFSPLVFDAGHSIIHSAFLLGASLYVLSKELIMDGEKLTHYLNNNSIDCIKIVPSLWMSYANTNNIILSNKVMIFGGENFSVSIFNQLVKVNYKGNVFNHYGPTETTIGKCIFKLDLKSSYTTIPIGKAFSKTKLYVVDKYDELVPVGVAGQLYIAGEGLARGYLNQPELTADRFISNPFSTDTFSRVYKTGDKVRLLEDGNIVYIGRIDDQVKVNGYRIELAEIESVLLKSKLVTHAIVMVREDPQGNKHLAAYIVTVEQFNKNALMEYLKRILPGYMIPALWFKLESIPLTGNGKINKKALENIKELNKEYVAPKNEVEVKLTTVWQDLLKIEKIGVHDNFFELGGNSIYAAILFAKIKKIFHKNFPLPTILNAPTIYDLGVLLKEKLALAFSSSSLVPIQPKGSKPPIFAVHAGGGDVLFYEGLSRHLGIDQPFYGLQAKGLNGIGIPFSQMEQMAIYYIGQMRKVQPVGPYYLVGYCLGSRITFEMAQQLINQGHEVALLVNINGISPTYGRSFNTANVEINSTLERVSAKSSFHLKQIKKLSLKEIISYISKKAIIIIVSKLREPFYLLRFQFNKSIYMLYAFFNKKVPEAIARSYVIQTLYLIQGKYKPKTYSGSIIIFRSPKIYKEPCLGWRNFVKGEIKTIGISGDHRGRRDIMNEPYVESLAKELKNFLV